METFAIGDVHGCADILTELLDRLPGDSNYLFIGDVVNRGPKSLECLRILKRLGPRARSLLGNHELHMLAVYCGQRELGKGDTIQEILEAPDCGELMDWIRTWPLAVEVEGCLAVHAACHWSWTKKETLAMAREVEEHLQSKRWDKDFAKLFGKTQWDPELTGFKRLRGIINVFTRTRYLKADGEMDYGAKLSIEQTSPDLIPWYKFPGRKTKDVPVLFGHWSTLGLISYPNVYPLDTGCLWGGSLTARPLSSPEKTISIKAPLHVKPW